MFESKFDTTLEGEINMIMKIAVAIFFFSKAHLEIENTIWYCRLSVKVVTSISSDYAYIWVKFSSQKLEPVSRNSSFLVWPKQQFPVTPWAWLVIGFFCISQFMQCLCTVTKYAWNTLCRLLSSGVEERIKECKPLSQTHFPKVFLKVQHNTAPLCDNFLLPSPNLQHLLQGILCPHPTSDVGVELTVRRRSVSEMS